MPDAPNPDAEMKEYGGAGALLVVFAIVPDIRAGRQGRWLVAQRNGLAHRLPTRWECVETSTRRDEFPPGDRHSRQAHPVRPMAWVGRSEQQHGLGFGALHVAVSTFERRPRKTQGAPEPPRIPRVRLVNGRVVSCGVVRRG